MEEVKDITDEIIKKQILERVIIDLTSPKLACKKMLGKRKCKPIDRLTY